MSTTRKIKFTYNFKGTPIEFNNISVEEYENGVYAHMRGVSQVVRQFVKAMFPEVGKFQISSNSYSMGDSVTVYLNEPDKEVYKIVDDTLRSLFQRYKNPNPSGITVELGDKSVTFDTKYFFTNSTPKYGTKAYEEWEKMKNNN